MEQILFDWLVSRLPGALVAEAAGISAVVVAVIALVMKYLPWARARKKWLAPVMALMLGQVAGFGLVGLDPARVWLAVGTGVLITLSAIGGHSTVKNIAQSVTPRARQRKPAA